MSVFYDEAMDGMHRGDRSGPGNRRAGAGVAAPLLLCLLILSLLLQTLPATAQSALDAAPGRDTALTLGPALQQPEFLPVEEAYPLGLETVGEGRLRLVWQMPPGYYLYQHAFRFRIQQRDASFEPAVELPPALEREDEFFGRVQVYYDTVDVTLDADRSLQGALLEVTSQGCADAGLCYPPRTQRFRIAADGSISERVAAAAPRPATSSSRDAGLGALLTMALLAFAGGVILNLMPCVFPVLSLKVVGFACDEARELRRQGWYYSAGVVCSFLAVAGLLLALRGAGQAIGWGFQLQSPTFVIALGYLFTIMGLALSGVVELGASLMNLGSGLAGRQGSLGSFFTGVLAVVVASPCTAPFMGTALGFALTQSPLVALAVFAALGMGMATPLLLLSHSAIARRLLPRPGPWMEKLRQGLAFPLYATALWLFWVAGRQAGVDVMAASLLGALLLAAAIWTARGGQLAKAVAVVCVSGAVALALWRPPPGAEATHLPDGAEAFTAQRLQQLLSVGQAVFVDVTADWCITCLANERTVLESAPVRDAFREHDVAYLVADWTDYDPAIADFVASHGRSGIPLYVLYDPDSGRPPRLLPQLLRRSVVIEALASVSAETSQELARANTSPPSSG